MTGKTISDEECWHGRGFRRMVEIITGRIASDITQATGLSVAGFAVLIHLSEGESGCRRQRDLQAFLEWDRTRLSHQLTRMAGRDLVLRRRPILQGPRLVERSRHLFDQRQARPQRWGKLIERDLKAYITRFRQWDRFTPKNLC